MAKRIVLGFGIAFVFSAFVHYAICTIWKQPKWQDYQIENYYEKHRRASLKEKKTLEAEKTRLEKQRRKDMDGWSTEYFYFGLPVGIIAILIGSLVKAPAIGSGLLGGGIIVLMSSYGHYWGIMADLAKLISLGIVFALLLWIGYKKVERKV